MVVHALRLHTCVAVALLATGVAVALQNPDEERMVGWKGETFDRANTFGSGGGAPEIDPAKDPWVEVISNSPRAEVYHNFLTDEEANHLLALSATQLKRSTVVGGTKNQGAIDQIRTSYGMFIPRHHDDIVTRVEEKLSEWTELPISHQEDIQILRYVDGQKYGSHYDSLGRVCTVLIYLTDTEEGGETAFSKTTDEHWAEEGMRERYGPFSSCAEGHVAARPKKGSALLFYSLKKDPTTGERKIGSGEDHFSMHTGCPVLKGVKYTATIWIHPEPFRPEWLQRKSKDLPKLPDPGFCEDSVSQCKQWAERGECDANPLFMKSENNGSGQCRKSCGECEDCPSKDLPCYMKNRLDAGYATVEDEIKMLAETQHVGHPLYD